jgi:uncharacterized protein YndB with AHSA1/START domain
MPTYSATRELLAGRDDVWAFLAEPRHLAEWWPGLGAIEPDRRGLAPGARWQLRNRTPPNILVRRRPDVSGVLVILDVRRPEYLAWQFVDAHLDAQLKLTETGPDRTRAELTLSAPFLAGLRRSLPHRALTRLHALCQTGARG